MLLAHPETESVVATLAEHVRRVLDKGPRRKQGPRALVGIGGTAATGKTTLARLLIEAVGERAAVVATDGYMMERPERRKRGITGPNPVSNDLPRLARSRRKSSPGSRRPRDEGASSNRSCRRRSSSSRG